MKASVDLILCSPPYAEALAEVRESRGPGQTSCHDQRKQGKRYTADGASSDAGYGTTDGQLGSMKAGSLPEAGTMKASKYIETTWDGCYDDNWKGVISEASFAHPAKMARGLLIRIYDYLFATGRLQRGSLVVDPFGGIGTTAIEGASRGCNVVCVELEQKFYDLMRANFALHKRTWEGFGDPFPFAVKGDSRNLVSILSPLLTPLADCCIGSPPFLDARSETTPSGMGKTAPTAHNPEAWGDTDGQLGALPAGTVDAVLSSPPYSECLQGDNSAKETAEESRAKRKTPGGSLGQSCRTSGYGETSGNLSNMKTADLFFCDGCGRMILDTQQPRSNRAETTTSITDGPGDATSHFVELGIPSSGTTCAEDVCAPVPSAEFPSAKPQSSAIPVGSKSSLSEPESGTKRKRTGRKSRRNSETALIQRTPDQTTLAGQVETNLIADQPGTFKNVPPASETATDASSADDQQGSSIISRTLHKPEASGTTASLTSNHDVTDVTQQTIPSNSSSERLCAACAACRQQRTRSHTSSLDDALSATESERLSNSETEQRERPLKDSGRDVSTANECGSNHSRHAGYGSDENLGNLDAGDVDAVISSPPWEKGAEGILRKEKFADAEAFAAGLAAADGQGTRHACTSKARLAQMERDAGKTYGDSDGQLGQQQGQTFWQAFRDILIQCRMILREAGTMVLVCKDFVRKGERVPFSSDTVRLAESCGFVLVEWIKASLVKRVAEASLFGGEEVKTTERFSFFRRLAHKRGSPRIEEEDVLVFVKKLG